MDTPPILAKPRPRWRRTLMRVVGVGVIGYVLVALMFYWLQDKVFFPGAVTQGNRIVTESGTTSLVKLSLKDGTPIVARFDVTSKGASSVAPTVMLLYGNGECAASAQGLIEILRGLGCNVLTPDYAGYGMSGGKASEASLYETANVCWAHLKQRTDIDAGKLYLFGWSLGGAVAIDLASRESPAGLITVSSFTSAREMAKHLMPILPSMIVRHQFASIDKIALVKCPLLIMHGQLDSMVPARMSQMLADRATAPKTLVLLPESDHNNLFDIDYFTITAALGKFLR